jgi:ABC-type sugar transport system substrate-binding protein
MGESVGGFDPELKWLTREFLAGRVSRRQWMGQALLAGVSLSGLSALLAACGSSNGSTGSSGGSSKKYTIGFLVPLISNPYWQLMQTFAVECSKQFNINLLTAQANTDDSKQISIVQDWISRRVDGMVVGPVDDTVGQPILSAVTGAKIPLTFMQRLPGVEPSSYGSDVFVGYVGTDDSDAGFNSAQTLYNAGARKWVAMTGANGNSVAVQRLQGMQKFASQHNDVQVLRTQFGNEARASGQTTMENFLAALPGPGFDGVWSFNDEGALGAINALGNAKINNMKVTMIDGTVDGCNAVVAGQAVATYGGGYACGTFALIELFDKLNGHKPDNRSVNIPLTEVNQNNVQNYFTQVLNGMSTYDFKKASATYTSGATTKDYKITVTS